MRKCGDPRQQRCPSTSLRAVCRQIGCRSKLSFPQIATQRLQQAAEQGGNETLRREGERGRGRGATLPCGCALPHIADAAFERLGGVPEGAHAAVPVALVRALLGVSFRP